MMWQCVAEAPVDPALSVTVADERLIMSDGLQPILFQTAAGTLCAYAGVAWPPGFTPPARNMAPIPRLVISRDHGRTWKRWLPDQPVEGAADPPNPALIQTGGFVTEGNALELANGTVMILEWIAEGPTSKGEWHGRFWTSSDDLRSFAGPHVMTIHLPQARGGFDDGGNPYSGLTFHRSLLELPNGDLLTTAYCWFEGDVTPCSYQPANCRYRCILLRSADGGRSWRLVNTIAVDPTVGEEGFDEPVLVRLSRGPHTGRLVCLMRTGSNNCPIYLAASDDEGSRWSMPRPLPFGGVDPDLIEMSDGTLACSFGWRIWGGGEMQNYYVVFSRDGGETWTNLTVLPLTGRSAVPYPCGTWYCGLRETTPGVLLVVYDVGNFPRDWPVKYIAAREVTVSRRAASPPPAGDTRLSRHGSAE